MVELKRPLRFEDINWIKAYRLLGTLEDRIARAIGDKNRKGIRAGLGVSPYYKQKEMKLLDLAAPKNRLGRPDE
jgi:hypothetical protein